MGAVARDVRVRLPVFPHIHSAAFELKQKTRFFSNIYFFKFHTLYLFLDGVPHLDGVLVLVIVGVVLVEVVGERGLQLVVQGLGAGHDGRDDEDEEGHQDEGDVGAKHAAALL